MEMREQKKEKFKLYLTTSKGNSIPLGECNIFPACKFVQ